MNSHENIKYHNSHCLIKNLMANVHCMKLQLRLCMHIYIHTQIHTHSFISFQPFYWFMTDHLNSYIKPAYRTAASKNDDREKTVFAEA